MKKSQLKQLIKEVAEELERNPEYIAGYRLGEKNGEMGERTDVSNKSSVFQLGYKKGYNIGRMSRWGSKISGGITKFASYFGDAPGRHRKFENLNEIAQEDLPPQIQQLISRLRNVYSHGGRNLTNVSASQQGEGMMFFINTHESSDTKSALIFTDDYKTFSVELEWGGKDMVFDNLSLSALLKTLKAYA